jgi:hypothetical protein
VLVGLCVEKVVQHTVVTWALAVDAASIRDTVEVDHRWLIAVGAPVGIAFGVAAVAVVLRLRWSLALTILLALVDTIGEFVAQGRLSITVTVSFLVAIAILVLAVRLWRVGLTSSAAS